MFIEFIEFYWNVRQKEETCFLSELIVYVVSILHLDIRNWKEKVNERAFV
jgi:hypothetical protein